MATVWSLLYGLTRNTLGVMLLRVRGDAAGTSRSWYCVTSWQVVDLQTESQAHRCARTQVLAESVPEDVDRPTLSAGGQPRQRTG
jgi:hypothetical protein